MTTHMPVRHHSCLRSQSRSSTRPSGSGRRPHTVGCARGCWCLDELPSTAPIPTLSTRMANERTLGLSFHPRCPDLDRNQLQPASSPTQPAQTHPGRVEMICVAADAARQPSTPSVNTKLGQSPQPTNTGSMDHGAHRTRVMHPAAARDASVDEQPMTLRPSERSQPAPYPGRVRGLAPLHGARLPRTNTRPTRRQRPTGQTPATATA